jgi:hypothetical protein
VDWRLEPHPLTPQDLKMKENPFVYEILSSGVKLGNQKELSQKGYNL